MPFLFCDFRLGNLEGNMKYVTAAVIREKGRILITRRSPGQTMAGFWEFPGGKIEADETPQRCLERELKEELGIDTEAGAVIMESPWHYDGGAITLLAIETEITGGELRLTVHDRVQWAAPEELETFRLSPADIPVARLLAGRR